MLEWVYHTRFIYDGVAFSVAFKQQSSSGIRVYKPRAQIEPWVQLVQAGDVRHAVELILAKASAPQVIGDLTIMDWGVIINRGNAALTSSSFQLSELYHDFFSLSSIDR